MIFSDVGLPGAYVVEIQKHEDDRGFFARTWCAREFQEHGLIACTVQSNVSFNKNKGTLRGLHYQIPPSNEAKLVRVTNGAVFDVIVDLRPQSSAFLKHFAIELNAQNYKALYIPPGFAHGFQTLDDNTEVFYQMSDYYQPELARGVRWDDPAFEIQWPEDDRIILDRDANYPSLSEKTLSELEIAET
jgi:dTDP-4-dehydrorhamnose 3,5-epimerase